MVVYTRIGAEGRVTVKKYFYTDIDQPLHFIKASNDFTITL